MSVRLNRRASAGSAQRGVTLIELLMAFVVILVGMTGGLLLLLMAIATNGRSKRDTEATSIAQVIVEQMSSRSAESHNTSFAVRDCRASSLGGPQAWTIETAGSASGQGARVNSVTADVDWIQSFGDIPANYKATYASCGSDGTIYEVRWNVRVLTTTTRLVTISARPRTSSFVPPVTLRTILGY
jgi:Tfp pilus assembly protein PilV